MTAQVQSHDFQAGLVDQLVFRDFYNEHVEFVWRTLRRLGVSTNYLPDVTQEVFILAWRKRSELSADRSLRPWLFAVGLRVASAHRRGAWFRLVSFGNEVEPADARPSPEESANARSQLAQLNSALSKVDLAGRALLVLHDLEEVPMNEAASSLGIPLKTAYARLHSGRAKFHKAYRQAELADKNNHERSK